MPTMRSRTNNAQNPLPGAVRESPAAVVDVVRALILQPHLLFALLAVCASNLAWWQCVRLSWWLFLGRRGDMPVGWCRGAA
jgi:hypothetical protein